MGFSKVEVVTSMNKLDNLKTALSKLGVSGITVVQADWLRRTEGNV